jgi:hypothetical protein
MVDPAIKKAFSKVKEDIRALEAKFELINAKLDQILTIYEQKTTENKEFSGIKPQNSKIQESSSGNKRVQSINHSTITQQSLTNQSLITQQSSTNQLISIDEKFKSLTNQEFLVFLTIYDLEEQLGRGITYEDLSSKLSLTSSCIRSYVSSMIRKKLPLTKQKINNRTILLRINPHFRDLGLKDRLKNLYLGQDPGQTRLI